MHELPRLRELRRRERDARTVDRLAARPPLAPPLSRDDLDALWRARNFACSSPTALPAFWLAVPRQDKHAVHEARLLLRKWHLGARRGLFSPRVRVALQLLWWQHSDAHAWRRCRVLDQLGDGDFGELLTQLVQALKIENHHDSALARLLIRRGASAPLRVGHRLFWLLRAEMATPHVCERYGVVVAAFLDVSSETFRRMLADQCHVDLLLHACARAVKAEPTKFLRFEAMKKCLCKVNDDLESRHGLLGGFTTPLSPTVVCHRIDVDKCAVLSSKKVPLFISLTHFDDDAGDYLLIYKEGDDLRQDQLALQLVRMLDALWRDHGLDLALEPYGCVATGRDAGFIEVVRDAKTTAEIQVEFGGGAIGAFNDTVVAGYLAAHNPAYRAYERARATFVATCAGYCVATFVLGIGDRHAGNIMVSKSGRLFHIDFGHFLGNFKSKFGVRRERSPFVFTPDMKHVMDYVSFDHREQRSVVAEIQQRQGQAQGAASPRLGFADFEQLCCRAYNVTRQHGSTIALLFALMIPAGMPELQTCDDISYLTDRLALQLSASEAANDFRAEIKNAMATTSRRIDNYIHNLRHA
ncbi:kinase-like domain-containing protein [Pelagophyceae sp. CCMP2097]|nr:kinase-like domain-containing protein [Pelagophyceae sp. CCMP2097]